MIPILLSILTIIVLIVAIYMVVQKRKRAGVTGVKTALTPICFLLIPVINLFAYWFGFMGIANWALMIVLLILGAYFTKFLPAPENN